MNPTEADRNRANEILIKTHNEDGDLEVNYDEFENIIAETLAAERIRTLKSPEVRELMEALETISGMDTFKPKDFTAVIGLIGSTAIMALEKFCASTKEG